MYYTFYLFVHIFLFTYLITFSKFSETNVDFLITWVVSTLDMHEIA